MFCIVHNERQCHRSICLAAEHFDLFASHKPTKSCSRRILLHICRKERRFALFLGFSFDCRLPFYMNKYQYINKNKCISIDASKIPIGEVFQGGTGGDDEGEEEVVGRTGALDLS